MRVRTLEIRWHDNKPISTCDFQPLSFKKARPANERDFVTQSYRLATGGEDNNVRIWMVCPNILPPSVVENASSSATTSDTTRPTPHPPRIEYLSTLSRHSAPVNVVRFSPSGDVIASAGDDGMIIVWAPSSSAATAAFGSDLAPEELQYEKEYWKARTPFRCTTMQVYDLAWSPTGEYIIAGSTDNTARIFSANDGKCIREIAEHSHYVQGVAWDPLNEFIATQSSDRSVHVYSVSAKQGHFDVHAVGKNSRMAVRHTRTPSAGTRPRMFRRESTASDVESAITTSDQLSREEIHPIMSGSGGLNAAPPTPAASIASTPSAQVFLPPPSERSMSRRSSFSSNAPGSPSQYSHIGRSPSPMPPLPAIRAPPSPQLVAQTRLYGDESFTNFYRRLTFSPDGGLLLTPAGQFEDPFVIPGSSSWSLSGEPSSSRGRKGHPSDSDSSASSVYIYSRASFSKPPIARLPGHKKASVAVKFSPILYELRPGVVGAEQPHTKSVAVERGNDEEVDLDIVGPVPATKRNEDSESSSSSPRKKPLESPSHNHPSQTLPSPALTAVDLPQTPVSSAVQSTATPVHSSTSSSSSNTSTPTGSVFQLPYRMLFAVATMDTITIHDTQQATPLCLLTKLHYDEFTDMAWSPDGQCLMLSSRDGYCTIVIFDQPIPAHHTQQFTIQLQSIAHSHHIPATTSHHGNTPSTSSLPAFDRERGSPVVTPAQTPSKRSLPLPTYTPTSSVFEREPSSTSDLSGVDAIPLSTSTSTSTTAPERSSDVPEPPKKKRRIALTHHGGLSS